MNLLCPNCQRMITVPDENAGQTMKCPLCAGSFTAPSLPGSMGVPASDASARASSWNPSPAISGGSDPSISAASKAEENEPFSSVTPSSLAGDYRRRYTIWISPRVVPWIAPVGLGLIFILFFFYWRSLPPVVENANLDVPPSRSGWGEIFSPNFWLILYLILYLATLILVLGFLSFELKLFAMPPQVKPLLPWRTAVIFLLALLAFFCLFAGFAIEDFPSGWFGLVVWIHLLVVLIGLALEYWLEYRGPGYPLPKIDIGW